MSVEALPAHRHLDALGIPWERRVFPPSTPKGAASVARVLGFRESQMVKTLIFESGAGERALIAVGGDRNVISGRLKKAMGNRTSASPARKPFSLSPDTGSAPSPRSPGKNREPAPSSIRRSPKNPLLGVGAGVWGEEILITPADLAHACGGIAVNLTRRVPA